MLATASEPDYCGITYNQKQDERSVQIAVRAHRTLELAEDKLYVVTCGRAGSNSRNEGTVRMGFYGEANVKLNEVVYGRAYKLRLDVLGIPEESAIRVRSCFSFGGINTSVPLVDDSGCSEQGVMSRWSYSGNNVAEATVYSMFRFQDSKRLNFQFDVLICPASECPNPVCNSAVPITSARRDTNETSVLAATTVSVLDPGDKAEAVSLEECNSCPRWLMWLAITLGVLFLLMLLVNLFLCSALTCTCTRTELVEKEPSVLEDYDPYRSWAGSQYGGSRYSLNNGSKPVYSVSAESNGSDHYATVPSRHSPSRPGSRYSQKETSPYSQNRKL
jgi:hypothetical protein